MRPAALALPILALLAAAPPASAEDPAQPAAPPAASAPLAPSPWCAPDLVTLPGDVCAHVPGKEANGPRTLVIFLHGVILPDSGWQWAQQRGAARMGAAHGFSVIMPRGRRGIGPKGMEDWWTWPTSAAAQKTLEDALVNEWNAARAELEKRSGKPFERVFVFGFSNGAYYATSLAMRGRLPVDGYAVFAGGSGAAYLEKTGAHTKPRPRFFVAWGGKDPAHRDQEALARMLQRLRWPAKAMGVRRAGHTMTDAQVAAAVRFLAGAAETAKGATKKRAALAR
jgi:predicted esterase